MVKTANISRIMRQGFWRANRGHILLAGIALLVGLSGCAGTAPRTPPPAAPRWQCDPEADAALKREAFQLGIRLHEALLKAQPDNALAWYHLGYACGQIGDHAREIACYERAQALGYTHDEGLFFNAGMAYLELDLVPQALEAFQQALTLNPDGADDHFGMALALQAAGDIPAAEARLRQTVLLDPGHIDARLQLALIYIQSGDTDGARAELQAVLARDPENAQARQLLDALEAR
ncbi:MAG: tetratricopeptide repeat protein [Desulfobacterales bacterium]